jgi:hypothetical protein
VGFRVDLEPSVMMLRDLLKNKILTPVVTVMRHGIFVLKIWGDRANPGRYVDTLGDCL